MIKNEITAEEIKNKCAPFKEKVIKRIEERAQQRHEFAMEYIYKIINENAISHVAEGAITIDIWFIIAATENICESNYRVLQVCSEDPETKKQIDRLQFIRDIQKELEKKGFSCFMISSNMPLKLPKITLEIRWDNAL